MKKALIVCLLLVLQVRAQEFDDSYDPSVSETPPTEGVDVNKLPKPLGRVKSTIDVNTESSSFIGDPDNIDPLNPRNENIKDDDEPVLDNIRDILNAPAKPAVQPSTSGASEGGTSTGAVKATTSKKKPAPSKARISKRSPDDPNLDLEKRFHNIYNRYNSMPTPEDVWQAASSQQQQRQYVVQKGDTLWSISKILFGDPSFWPKLWSLNKQGILNPHFITPNTIIYFFAGDAQNSPTLSVGSPMIRNDGFPSGGGSAPSGPVSGNGVIPPSIPEVRNTGYFDYRTRDVSIQLDEIPSFPYVYNSDIVITDTPVKTAVKLQIAETAKFRCYNGRLVKSIRYSEDLDGEYEVFSPLDTFKSASGTMYAYRIYGTAVPYENRYMKILNCKDVITSDLVILPKGRMQTLKTQKVSPTRSARLVGGPDVVSQRLFALHQKAYVDFGSYPYEVGQEYQTRSQVTDDVNGQIRVLEKNGSYAVVIVTSLTDVLEIGDRLITLK
ncbi:LysM peptidoglycan-binding domain-containing protein [Pseudobdellovibrio exovorus]|uniref:Signal peptide protein n=1 Tax=Pseudobdellovibrio exovorus JSS TaxID=1184267 RepID=M4V9R4_9BACT|nr:LysM peptidoglycan-binding domain-containing protein [Pseudobdellovibrio exovorus]AGH95190.1 signal peptide protein [Pseudobdellovibrio exovorus JSS]